MACLIFVQSEGSDHQYFTNDQKLQSNVGIVFLPLQTINRSLTNFKTRASALHNVLLFGNLLQDYLRCWSLIDDHICQVIIIVGPTSIHHDHICQVNIIIMAASIWAIKGGFKFMMQFSSHS